MVVETLLLALVPLQVVFQALQNGGPTEESIPITVLTLTYADLPIANVQLAVPMKFDVSIPSGTKRCHGSIGVIVQSLSVASGAMLAANGQFHHA